MNVYNMSLKKYNQLESLKLESGIFNSESRMYIFEGKDKMGGEKLLLKRLNSDFGTIFSNKLYTINELVCRKDDIAIEELIMPEKLISVHGAIVGFSMLFVDNINFQTVLNSSEFSIKEKIGFFKEIGIILEKMEKFRKHGGLFDFYLNDIHENNFILNKKTGKINVVDLDSCKINNNLTFGSRYLSFLSPIRDVSKYQKNNEPFSIGAYFEIDKNTNLYCYNLMVLNYLFGSQINRISVEEIYDYLSYLHRIGVSWELVDKFSLLYSEKDNVNSYQYLDELSKIGDKANYKVYRLSKKNIV